jgi:hypothetical protein
MNKNNLIMVSFLVLIISCQKKLTKDEALSLIVGGGYMKVIEKERISLYEQFQVTYVNYIENLCDGATICSQPWIDDSHRPWGFVSKEDQKILDVLQNNKLISIDDSSDFSSCCVKRLISLRPLKDTQKLMEKYAKIEEVTGQVKILGISCIFVKWKLA